MKKRKLISCLSVAMGSMMLLGGCGNATTSSSSDDSSVTSSSESGKVDGYVAATDSSKNVQTALNRKDTLIIGIDAPDGVFNPLYCESQYDRYIVDSIFEGLMSVDESGLPIESLAESYSVSEDGLVYKFTLKEDLKFSDGSPLTTEDVAFTYTIACDSSYDGPSDFVNATKIKGAKAYKEGTATSVEGINVIDDKNIEFTLEEVNAGAIYDFTAGILSKAHYGAEYTQGNLDYIKNYHTNPLGSGAYKFVSNKAGQETVLVANENYFKGTPNIKNIIYKVTSEETRIQMLKTGEIDMDMVTVNEDNVQTVLDAEFLDLHIFPTNGYGYIGFNVTDEKFADAKVRQALTYGLNRAEIVEAAFTGGYADVINVPQSKESWAYTPGENSYEYDPEKAAKVLDEAGWVVGSDGIREKDGEKLTIKFTASTPNAVNEAIIPIAQANYSELGIKFEAEQMDFNAVREKVNNGTASMFFMAWSLTPDPDSTNVFGTNGSQNRLGYSNAKVDELLAKGLQTTDIDERAEIYNELYNELNEDLPYILLYQRKDMWVINSRVKGFENNITAYKDFTASLYQLTLES